MGVFQVKGRLTDPTARVEEVELLVDTGATLSVVPRSLSKRLELKTTRTQSVVIAGGRRDVWPIAEARLALNGDAALFPQPLTECFGKRVGTGGSRGNPSLQKSDPRDLFGRLRLYSRPAHCERDYDCKKPSRFSIVGKRLQKKLIHRLLLSGFNPKSKIANPKFT